MKKFLAMVMTVAMVISMMTVVSFAAGTVVAINAEDVTIGNQLVVNIVYPATTNGIGSGAVELVYDNTKLQVADMVVGNVLSAGAQANPNYSADSVFFNWAFGTVPAASKAEFVMATVTFNTIAEGDVTFSYRQLKGRSGLKNIAFDTTVTKTVKVKAAGPSYTNGYYDLKTNADNTASVSYFGTVGAATLYVATYKAVGTGYELAGVATKDIAAGKVAELTTVTTDAVKGGDVIKAFLWDADLNTVAWSVLPE